MPLVSEKQLQNTKFMKGGKLKKILTRYLTFGFQLLGQQDMSQIIW